MITPEEIAAFSDAMPDMKTVTFYPRSGGTFASGQSVTNAEKRPITAKEMASIQGFLSGADIIWHIWDESVTTTPKSGDKIVDDESTTWLVKYAVEELLGQRHRLFCTKGK